jgi:hypothetical protein
MLLFLLNPGRQSRHYMLGLFRAAERLCLPHIAVELGPLWDRVAAASDKRAALQAIQIELARLVATHKVTHALGYVYNGTFDIGLVSQPSGLGRGLFPSLGVRQVLLWTDHPEWASGGIALRPPLVDILRDPLMTHIVKSDAAAAEAREVLRWPQVISMPMAEDYESLQPAQGIEPIHDVVAILGDGRGVSPAITGFLEEEDPNPAVIDDVMRPDAIARFAAAHPHESSIASAWLDAKRAEPSRSFWSLARTLDSTHATTLSRLRATPEHWYSAVQSLRVMVEWRRYFWLAWLARRVNVGVYGSSTQDLGIPQTVGAADWVPYDQQPAVYARGRVALNTNAAHDEEGMTHKPFQIAASGVPLVHHDTRGLSECFDVGREILTFRRGPELLDAVRTLLGDAAVRASLGGAFRSRALRDHTWEARLTAMLRPIHAATA